MSMLSVLGALSDGFLWTFDSVFFFGKVVLFFFQCVFCWVPGIFWTFVHSCIHVWTVDFLYYSSNICLCALAWVVTLNGLDGKSSILVFYL